MVEINEKNSDDEDFLHSAILAKHGISYSESPKDEGGKFVPVCRDAADRILDAMDKQLGDVLQAKIEKDDVNDEPCHANLDSVCSLRNRVASDLATSTLQTNATDVKRSGDVRTVPEDRYNRSGALSARISSKSCTERDFETPRRRRMDGRHSNMTRLRSVTRLCSMHMEDYNSRHKQMTVHRVAGVPMTPFCSVTTPRGPNFINTVAVRENADNLMKEEEDNDTNIEQYNRDHAYSEVAGSAKPREHETRGLRGHCNHLIDEENHDPAEHVPDTFTTLRPFHCALNAEHRTESRYKAKKGDSVIIEELKVDHSLQTDISDPSQYGTLLDHRQATPRRSSGPRHRQVECNSIHCEPSKPTSRTTKHDRVQSEGQAGGKNQPSAEGRSNGTSRLRDFSNLSPRRLRHNDNLEPSRDRHHAVTKNALNKLQHMETQIDGIENKKKNKERELRLMEKTMDGHRISLMKLEERLRESEAKADGAKTELMVLEFKKEQCKKELESATEERTKMHETVKGTQDMGMTCEDIAALMRERDELRARFRRGDASRTTITERQELERALNTAKDDLFRSRKAAREKVEALEEKLDEVEHKYEAVGAEKDLQIKQLESVIHEMEKDKSNEAKAQERADAIEAEKRNLYGKLDALTKQLQLKDNEIVSLATESNKLREGNRELRGKIAELESKVTEEIQLKEKLLLEAENNASAYEKIKEQAIVSVRQEKESEIEQLRQEIEKENTKTISECKFLYQEETTKLQSAIKSKEEEVEQLRERLHNEEDAKRALGEKLRMDAKEQVRSVVAKERFAWEQERQAAEKREDDLRRASFEKDKSQLISEADEARSKHRIAAEQISRLRTDIDELRLESRKLLQDKLDAVSNAREQERRESLKNLNQLRTELEELNRTEIEKERNKRSKLEEELRKSKQDEKEAVIKCKELTSSAVRSERCFSADVHAECQKIEDLICGIRTPSQLRSRSTAAATDRLISNQPVDAGGVVSRLRGLANKIRATLRDLTAAVETHRRAAQIARREMDETVSNGGNWSSAADNKHLSQQIAELNGHNSQDLKALLKQLVDKDNELRDIQKNMSSWKDATTQKLAQKFEEELALQLQRKLGRHRTEHKRQMKMMEEEATRFVAFQSNGHPSSVRLEYDLPSSAAPPISNTPAKGSAKLLRHLHGRVKQLRVENDFLRSGSQIMDQEGFCNSR